MGDEGCRSEKASVYVEISPVKSEVLIEVVQPRSKANVARKQSSQAGKRRKEMGRKKGSHQGADERDKETQVNQR